MICHLNVTEPVPRGHSNGHFPTNLTRHCQFVIAYPTAHHGLFFNLTLFSLLKIRCSIHVLEKCTSKALWVHLCDPSWPNCICRQSQANQDFSCVQVWTAAPLAAQQKWLMAPFWSLFGKLPCWKRTLTYFWLSCPSQLVWCQVFRYWLHLSKAAGDHWHFF